MNWVKQAKIGDRVVCVTPPEVSERWETIPVKGQTYTIREIVADAQGVFFRLNEVTNPLVSYSDGDRELSFRADRFKPVDGGPGWVSSESRGSEAETV